MFYSIKIKKRKRFYLASFLDVSQEMNCFFDTKILFILCNCCACAKTKMKYFCILDDIAVKMILNKGR